jgi:hypothetical protein
MRRHREHVAGPKSVSHDSYTRGMHMLTSIKAIAERSQYRTSSRITGLKDYVCTELHDRRHTSPRRRIHLYLSTFGGCARTTTECTTSESTSSSTEIITYCTHRLHRLERCSEKPLA